jgi:hypothetical protein
MKTYQKKLEIEDQQPTSEKAKNMKKVGLNLPP